MKTKSKTTEYDARFVGTSLEYYISGTTALNIPTPALGGGWYLTSILTQKKVKLHLAGTGPDSFVDTNASLGSNGIFECSGILQKKGANIPSDLKVFSANHHRAILDLLVKTARAQQDPSFIRLSDYFDTDEEKEALIASVETALPKLNSGESSFIHKWLLQKVTPAMSI